MGKSKFREEFKRNAVCQTVDRSYPVAEVKAFRREPAFALQMEEEVW